MTAAHTNVVGQSSSPAHSARCGPESGVPGMPPSIVGSPPSPSDGVPPVAAQPTRTTSEKERKTCEAERRGGEAGIDIGYLCAPAYQSTRSLPSLVPHPATPRAHGALCRGRARSQADCRFDVAFQNGPCNKAIGLAPFSSAGACTRRSSAGGTVTRGGQQPTRRGRCRRESPVGGVARRGDYHVAVADARERATLWMSPMGGAVYLVRAHGHVAEPGRDLSAISTHGGADLSFRTMVATPR